METPAKPKRRLSRGSRVWLLLTLAMLGLGLLTLFAQPERRQAATSALPGFELQGQRAAGSSGLSGFSDILALGVTTLAFDVALEAEATPRVSTESALDEAAWREGRAASESGPSLAEVFALAEARSAGRIRYAITITAAGQSGEAEAATPEALVEPLLAVLRTAGVESRVMVLAFDWRLLAAIARARPEITRIHATVQRPWLDTLQPGTPGASPWTDGLDFDVYDGSVAALVAAAGGRIWAPYYRDLRQGEIAEAKGQGLAVIAWPLRDPADMTRLLAAGVDGIVTDRPERLRAALTEAGRALPPVYPEP
jgi:glycerophosphoryl diester phosphodiesterase